MYKNDFKLLMVPCWTVCFEFFPRPKVHDGMLGLPAVLFSTGWWLTALKYHAFPKTVQDIQMLKKGIILNLVIFIPQSVT